MFQPFSLFFHSIRTVAASVTAVWLLHVIFCRLFCSELSGIRLHQTLNTEIHVVWLKERTKERRGICVSEHYSPLQRRTKGKQ